MPRFLVTAILAVLVLAYATTLPGLAVADGAKPVPVTEMAKRAALPALRFMDRDGNEVGLDGFNGKIVVLNLWATWCAPCIKEMPSLARLQTLYPKDQVLVVALSVDRGGERQVAPFLERMGITELSVYLDPKATAPRALGLPGLPGTLLIDRTGREAARVYGDVDWDGPNALAAIKQLLGETPAG